ncbi:MAG: 4-hydroxy-3-methylbut-2-enyl diphosphate reductase, partial [Candidatus Omnitrophica bacterium]|nr:4-hydroxy-3-methylbut-2-enyl diphosphate reductase [Candidatus Omnitrophota bacterium]
MQISVARSIGFCSGVKRAIEIVNQLIKEKRKDIFCFGPIIHNELVQEKLKKKGVNTIYSLKEIKNPAWLILPSHGATRHTLKIAKRKKLNIIDATCPNVASLQRICQQLHKQKYQIIILGDKGHPEIKALLSIAPEAAVIKDKSELKKITLSSHVVLISHTTQNLEKFQSLINNLFKYNGQIKELRIFNTICLDSIRRQKEVKLLASQNDAVFIVGSSSSANTKRLLRISRRINKHSYLIKQPDEAVKNLKLDFKKIGIISGAS